MTLFGFKLIGTGLAQLAALVVIVIDAPADPPRWIKNSIATLVVSTFIEVFGGMLIVIWSL
jgi:hypothetical protein